MTLRRGLTQLVVGLALVIMTAAGAQAQQATVMGRVTDEAGTPLANVQVLVTHQVTGTERGAYTNEQGQYMIRGLNPRGPYRIEAKRIGYGTDFEEVAAFDPSSTVELNFALGNEAVALDAVEVLADRAVEQQTPVAYSSIDQVQIKRQLASRDLPLVLNTKPSVYATAQGGGAGDARINVRGFSQRNVAVMINGVPVNDMENGWVYWSNWDGVGDFTRSIQLQRGMSAVNLATPSIGGSLNLITDPTEMDAGATVKQEFGDGGFMKTTISASTGMISDKFAIMGAGIRKTGDGIAAGTWTDSWAYYFAASWILDNSNRLDLYATGAPQRHGQRLYAQNIGTFSHSFAEGLESYDPAAMDAFLEQGQLFNQNVQDVRCGYDGLQAVGSETFSRHACGILNERENFYHKPQVNLNWFSQLNNDMMLSTVAYYSGGRGGGTGTLGDVYRRDAAGELGDDDHAFFFGPAPWQWDWNATIDANQGPAGAYTVDMFNTVTKADGQSIGILRNSRNNQYTFGLISKLEMHPSDALAVEFGLDARTAEIEHYREVRDLLGGDYWVKTADDFNPNQQVGLGEKIDYFNTNRVNWIGGHVQGEYFSDAYTAYGMAGLSAVKYNFTDHFTDDGTGNELNLEANWQPAFQVKGGGLYNLSDELRVFANAGYIQQMPIFDQVINDVSGEFVENPENQKFISAELGARYRSMEMPFQVSGNLYYTQWLDRVSTSRFFDEAGQDIFITLTGLQQRHAGVEFEAGYQPIDLIRFDISGSYNMWEYTDDVEGTYRPEGGDTTYTYQIYVDGLKVGNAPQRQLAYYATLFPIDGAYIQVLGKTFGEHYADFNPFDRTDPSDTAQPWQAPGYTVLDLHAGYNLPQTMTRGVEVQLFVNGFNLLDTMYIQDALDNSRFNSFDQDHDADDAEVHFGLPRRFTFGASVAF